MTVDETVSKKKSTNLLIKFGIHICIGAIALSGIFWVIDSRFKDAADSLRILKETVIVEYFKLRQDTVEDKIFELNVKKESQHGKLMPLEQSLLDRYKQEAQNYKEQTIGEIKCH